MTRRAALVTALALCAGACGGAQPMSSQQLRDRAGTICSTASAAANAIPRPGLDGMPRFIERGLAVLDPELTALRTLHPTGAAGATYGQALDSFAAELSALRRAQTRLRTGADTIVTTQRLQRELRAPESRARHAWQALGISSCLA